MSQLPARREAVIGNRFVLWLTEDATFYGDSFAHFRMSTGPTQIQKVSRLGRRDVIPRRAEVAHVKRGLQDRSMRRGLARFRRELFVSARYGYIARLDGLLQMHAYFRACCSCSSGLRNI
ncbi:hypothetical protein PsYK624_167360 [Phanerochaete sordida]|uniref:Uncharacterized protein n=1 Tax=Phanerochaete sordida TaxID=48140 RepID=A0A9P3GS12_9APHY|nr:hypothetical protein PsYK624_167360 [Phanerochaete sordida]